MKTPPELNPTLTEQAQQQRYKLVGPANIAHYFSHENATAAKKAGYELVPMLCGLQLAPNDIEARPAPAEGRARLVCAECYQLAQWDGHGQLTQIFPLPPLEEAA